MTSIISVCPDWEASDSIVILRKLERNINVTVTEHDRKVNPYLPVGKRIITTNIKLVIMFLALVLDYLMKYYAFIAYVCLQLISI